MTGLVLLTMAIVYMLPRLTRAVPPALVAILGVGLLVYLFGLPTAPSATWRTSPAACRLSPAGHPMEPGNPAHHRAIRDPDGAGRSAGNPDPEPHR
jgi:hypothetical protein